MATLVVDEHFDGGTPGNSFTTKGAIGPVTGVAVPTYSSAGYLSTTCMEVNTGTGAVQQMVEITTASSTTKVIDFVWWGSATYTTLGIIATARGTADVARAIITSTNVLRLTNGAGGATQTMTTQLPVAAYWRGVLSVVGNTATLSLYLDPTSTTPTETLTTTVTGAAMTLHRIGNVNGLNMNGGVSRFDWVEVSNDGIPDPRSTALTATAVVSPTAGLSPLALTLTISPTGGTGSFLYAVTNWGDGSSSPQQSSNVFTRTITQTVTVDTAKNATYTVVG